MPEPVSTLEPSERPCIHCGTGLYDEVRFCFECGAPVVPELDLPCAPASALEELRTAAFSAVSIRPIDDDEGLEPGTPIEIESIAFEAAADEVPIELEEDDDPKFPAETEDSGVEPRSELERVAEPSGTVVALAPERPFPFWPAPPKGETVLAPPPSAPTAMP